MEPLLSGFWIETPLPFCHLCYGRESLLARAIHGEPFDFGRNEHGNMH